jgi:hypothetical protein
MTKFLRCAALGFAGLVACSGNSVNLDQPMAAAGSPGAGGGAAAELVFEQHGAPLVNELLVDDARLYWQTEDFVFQSCLKSECQHSVITYSKTADLNGWKNIAVSGGQVFWRANPPQGEIDSCPSAGCAAKPTRLIRDPDMNVNAGISSQNGDVYWRSTFDLYRCAASGCGQAPTIVDLGDERDMPQFDGAYAYWIDSDVNTGSAFIRRAPLDGSSPAATLYEITDTPLTTLDIQSLAIAGDRVYWTDAGARVLSCPSTGCSGDPTVLDSSTPLKGYLQADSAGVYWIEGEGYPYDSNSVHFCPSAGCDSGSSALTGLGVAAYALGADSVYYIDQVSMNGNGMGGQIHRMAKPPPGP